MERYCIDNKEKNYENREPILQVDERGIRTHKFTLLEVALNDVGMLYPECRQIVTEILKNEEGHGDATTEEIMYQDILASVYGEELMLLDIYLHMYYTVLYEKNKNSFVPLAGGKKLKICENCREQKEVNKCVLCDKFRECEKYINYRDYSNVLKRKRKNWGDYEKNKESEGKRYLPFDIKENKTKKKSLESGKEYYEEVQILDFAPEVTRLYYISKEFRNIFNGGKKVVEDKFWITNAINLFKANEDEIDIM